MGASDAPGETRWSRHVQSKGQSFKVRDHEDLNARRLKAGLSLRQLAVRAGCSKAMIGFLCNGERDGVYRTTVIALAKALDDVDPSELVLDWEPAEPNAQTAPAEPERESGAVPAGA